MISLQTSKQILSDESFSKKRKMEGPTDQETSEKPAGEQITSTRPGFDSDLEKQTQTFSADWQRCLDIKSGQIYYYNTRTNKRALADSRSSPEQHRPAAPMSLELELNLPCQSDSRKHDSGATLIHPNHRFKNSNTIKGDGGLARSPSWLTFEGEQQEMVTAVCKNCYMLVMMCRSTPSCPNCKFVHPSEIKD